MDNKGVNGYDLNKYTARLAKNSLSHLKSTRRQGHLMHSFDGIAR